MLYARRAFFRDVTMQAVLGVETRFVGRGAGMVDIDNDGLPDLFVSTGMVYPELEMRYPEYPWQSPSILFRNPDGARFEQMGAQALPQSRSGTAAGAWRLAISITTAMSTS